MDSSKSSIRVPGTAPLEIAPTISNLLGNGGNELFRRLVDSVRDYAIFLLTPQGTVASWNPGAERIKGYTAQEIIGQHFSVFYPQEAIDRGWPDEELRQSVTFGRLEDEGWRLRKDGSRFWANVVISPLVGANGELLGFSKVTRDLTERREAEQRVRESERSLRLLVESVQDYAIFTLDCDGVIRSWNTGAQRIKGYEASEAIGKHFSMLYEPSRIVEGWPQEELRLAQQHGRLEDEGWRLRKNGSRFWANVVITAIRDEHGSLVGFSKVTRDLTERRQYEEQLREREENLRLLVEGVKDHAMFLLDPQGNIQTWNPGAQRVLGYEANQVLGRDVAMFYPEDEQHPGRVAAELAHAKAAGYLLVESWRQRADGSRFWAEIATTALFNEQGICRGFVRIVRDMTEGRRVETLELEGKRVAEFIAMLSHELRNPLAPIRNAVSILKRFVDKPEAVWCVELVGRQVGHLGRLVDDLLDFTRVTRGKIQIDPVVLELNTLVRMAVESTKATVMAHGHSLNLHLARCPVPIKGDTTRLTQVVVNLMTNAAKYTPQGGRIDVHVGSDGNVATLRVVDNGIGMTESLLQRAFEPFVQGVRGLDRAEGGLGIGLALVKTIVGLHGGSVSAASAGPGMGTTFTVTLPLSDSDPEPAVADVQTLVPAARRVLVVDDNKDAAESMALLLRMSGHEVSIARDGAEALTLAPSLKPESVLLDIGLPGMDGYELARRLRGLPGLEQVQVVAVTGYGQDTDRQAAVAAGIHLHLTKPVDPQELARLLA
nr:PAS domain S-box protein [Azohydromonas australica]